MVFDLNKCIGCQTCAVACKMLDEGRRSSDGTDYMWWCINTMPGRGYPRTEQMGRLPTALEQGRHRLARTSVALGLQLRGGVLRRQRHPAHFAPVGEEPAWGPNWDEDQGAGDWPNSYFFYLPRLCNHCTHPACVEACPNGAMFKREEDGLVLRDESLCQGDQACAAACPYKKIFFNEQRRISQQCIMCFPRLEQGVAPACARQCPGRLVFVGYLDDEEGPIHKLVHEWQVALPLHPEYGTSERSYVPPLAPPV